jgi:hypothetical protein
MYMRRLAHPTDRREFFLNVELTYLLRSVPPTMIKGGGDFNCVLTNTDSTGNIKFRKALEKVVRGFGLVDVGKLSLQGQYIQITLLMKRHALIKCTSHQTLMIRT